MLKVFVWFVSKDGRFFQNAMSILERQHGGLEVVGVTAATPVQLNQGDKIIPFVPLAEVATAGGGMMSCSSSAQKISA